MCLGQLGRAGCVCLLANAFTGRMSGPKKDLNHRGRMRPVERGKKTLNHHGLIKFASHFDYEFSGRPVRAKKIKCSSFAGLECFV
jgi:hypothetical protein